MTSEYVTEVEHIPSEIIKLVVRDATGDQVARASLVLITNEINPKPYGLLEDVFVREDDRGGGHGSRLVERIVDLAKEKGCYKLIATSRYSRPRVHALYTRLGLRDHGKEFRMDLSD